MDRRHFIKTGVLATGALAAGLHSAEAAAKGLNASEAAERISDAAEAGSGTAAAAGRGKQVDGKTPLGIKGYVSEPARRIPVVDSV